MSIDSIMRRTIKQGECSIWTGAKQHNYGSIKYKGKNWRVHRLVWSIENGPIPSGAVICHACDNPSCCNINHLFCGTQSDNIRDCAQKGRAKFVKGGPTFVRGESHGNSKLNIKSIFEIRLKIKDGTAIRAIARDYGVSQRTISFIKSGETWSHVK